MNTPVFPLRGGSLRVRGPAPQRDESGEAGRSKLWVFLSSCLLEEEEEEEEEGGMKPGEQTSCRTDSSKEEELRSRRRRNGVRCGVGGDASRIPQSPDFLEEAELVLTTESERRRWAESRVRSAASIFLSNVFSVS